MNANIYITRDYVKSCDWTLGKNKAKQSQYAGLWPEIYALGIRNTNIEIRDELNGCS